MRHILKPGTRVRFARKADRERYGDTGVIRDHVELARGLGYGVRPDSDQNATVDTFWSRVSLIKG